MAKPLFSKVDIVSYDVTDWQRAKKFYSETLGLPVAEFYGDEVGWMEFGEKAGSHLAISKWMEDRPMPKCMGGATVVFMVPDAYETVKELRSRGVHCEDVVPVPGMVTYANFYDPDGNKLQVAGPAPVE